MEFQCKNNKSPTIPHIFSTLFSKKFLTGCVQPLLYSHYQQLAYTQQMWGIFIAKGQKRRKNHL
jgi:hypothetical protein